ncbi:hypothetical protein BGZ80_001251 [Entomortierella chlamydospora]|uniref:Uncharacterized protein n=1 Tax=Entomortierella chlamydospora TaxID=101097 RepID=A0A9P6MS49_9FUNG|nr:hypothetical protein BGZ80_001251 [Entomortierella chlamydospora]
MATTIDMAKYPEDRNDDGSSANDSLEYGHEFKDSFRLLDRSTNTVNGSNRNSSSDSNKGSNSNNNHISSSNSYNKPKEIKKSKRDYGDLKPKHPPQLGGLRSIQAYLTILTTQPTILWMQHQLDKRFLNSNPDTQDQGVAQDQ